MMWAVPGTKVKDRANASEIPDVVEARARK